MGVPESTAIAAILLVIRSPLYLLAKDSAAALSPEAALQALLAGNNRFVDGHLLRLDQAGLGASHQTGWTGCSSGTCSFLRHD